MDKIYIYPTYNPYRDKSGNLYIKYFHESFKKLDNIKITNRLWKIGITSILFNLDADIFIVQWVDLIPRKRFGKIQFIFYLLSIIMVKILRKKIVWVLHNKQAHKGASRWVDVGMNFMSMCSTLVVTHSSEGVSFFNSRYPKMKGKCLYIPHPVYSEEKFEAQQIEYDYIIWGSIARHKNVLDFLEFADSSYFMKSKSILICGRCTDKIYDNEIKSIISRNPNITYINRFFSDNELHELIAKCRFILFTYNNNSTLSSGALIYSLNFFKPIIGPRLGNFADLNGIVKCFDYFKDIENIAFFDNAKEIEEYIKSNLWDDFPYKILKVLYSDNEAIKWNQQNFIS